MPLFEYVTPNTIGMGELWGFKNNILKRDCFLNHSLKTFSRICLNIAVESKKIREKR